MNGSQLLPSVMALQLAGRRTLLVIVADCDRGMSIPSAPLNEENFVRRRRNGGLSFLTKNLAPIQDPAITIGQSMSVKQRATVGAR